MREWTMKRKLFGYMLLLTALLLLALMSGLFILGRFDSTEKNTYEYLELQMDVFDTDISSHFDRLAATAIQLSEDMTELLEEYLLSQDITFQDINDSPDKIRVLHESMIEPLRIKLLQEHCSGVFVMLDATVNSTLPNSVLSKTGLYLQISGYETANQDVILYRGLSDIGKEHNIMPHGKWHLEFNTDEFPNYKQITANASLPLHTSYYITDMFTLPGTSDTAILLVVPMINSAGTLIGICGYEISTSFFATYHAQPTNISHPTCLLLPGTTDILDTATGFSCGMSGGYYRSPKGQLSKKDAGNGLVYLYGDSIPYIGVTRTISLSSNNPKYTLVVMMPKSDYDHARNKNALQNIILWSLILFFAIHCCLFFSRKFLSPILIGLEQAKCNNRYTSSSSIPEINDLFAFLADQDKAHEDALNALEHEKQNAQKEKERLQKEYENAQCKYETAQTEIARLAYSRKQEIDPDDYKQFLAGIDTLTPTEYKIFEYYLEGKNVKEIINIAGIKESTLRYHNQNIYGKLGVNSLKQLLRYAALKQQNT